MSAKSPLPVVSFSIICGLATWGLFVHFFSVTSGKDPVTDMMVSIVLGVQVFAITLVSAKSPFSVVSFACVSGLASWSLFVHLLFAEAEPVPIVVVSILLSGQVWIIAFFGGLTVRDTLRRRGVFGINFKLLFCAKCGMPRRKIAPPTWHQFWYEYIRGIWTCHECGFLLNQWSRPDKDQANLAKWSVLRKAADADEWQHRWQHRDEQILKFHEQTQQGDVS